VVSLVAFLITAYGMNPYVVASFSSGFACENARAAILSAALEQTANSTSTYAMTPRSMKCIPTPGLLAPGSRPPDTGTPQRLAPPKAPSVKKPQTPKGAALK